MLHGGKVAVVVPAYNEERLVARTIRSIPVFVDRIVVVDDGSADATCDEARRAGEGDRRVEVVRHARNRGVGAAIATGYSRALSHGADWMVVMAGDAQMDPSDLPALLAPLARGEADYVKGDRLAAPDVLRVMPFVRLAGTWVLSHLTRAASGLRHVRDSQCGYTAITREAAAALPLARLYPRYGYPNDLLGWLGILGARVVDIPVRPVYGGEKSGMRLYSVIPRILWLLARTFLRRLRSRLTSPRLTERESSLKLQAPGSSST